MTFCFPKTNFFHSRFWTYYALLLEYFGRIFLPDVLHCVYSLLTKIWAPDSFQDIGNKFFIDHCQGWKETSFVCGTVWFFSWVNTHPFDLKFVAFCPKFSEDSYMEFQEQTISGEFFRNFVQTKAIVYLNLWNSALLSTILFWVRIAVKKITLVLSYVVCNQVRRPVHKQITKRRLGRKARTFLFLKNQFCSFSIFDLLRLTAWVFLSEVFTRHSSLCLKSFGWDLSPRFVRRDWH